MKTIHGREQGCWTHPALYEVGKAIKHCSNMRMGDGFGGCPKRDWMTRAQWCENCVASEALGELATIIRHLSDHSTCICEGCKKNKEFLANGAENDRKYGIHSS